MAIFIFTVFYMHMKIFSLFKNQSLQNTASDVKQAVKVRWQEIPSSRSAVPCMMFEKFGIKNEKAGDIFVKTAKVEGLNNYKILVESKSGRELGFEEFVINPKNKNIYGSYIKVASEYRQKGWRLGEVMRLASIMEMIKNNSRQIRIYSKDTAVYFHAKYKFQPAIYRIDERDSVLEMIMKDKSKNFGDLADEAKKIFKQIRLAPKDDVTQIELCKPVNNLVQKYIERALQEPNPEKNHPFTNGINMLLSKSTVIENKDFFNKLYEKHGIDYKI